MAERIVPEAGLRPSAAPVDRFVAPVLKQAPASNGWLDAAAALSTLNPSLNKFLGNRYADGAATSEAEGQLAEQGLRADFEFSQGRKDWGQMIAAVRKQDPATADKMAGANPHFRRGMIKARMNRIGMGLNDHLMNLWRENPEFKGQQLHSIDDPAAISQWLQDATNSYTERFGVADMDPLLVAEVYGKRVQAAQEQLMARHTEFRLNRYNEEYMTELSANTGLILSGGGTTSSSIDSFLDRLGGRESSNNYGASNNATGSSGRKGHYGRIQFGHDRLDEARAAGVIPKDMTAAEFLKSTEAQRATEIWHINDIDRYIEKNGFLDKGYSLDGMRAVAHLGGKGGLNKFIMTGGKYDPKDAYGTHLSDYYTKFSGPAAELQGNLDAAVADGMNPTQANKTIVESVVRTAIETGNADVLKVLDDITTGSGALSNIGWVKDMTTAASEKIEQKNWQTEQRQYTLDQREKEQKKVELQTEGTRQILTDPYGTDLEALQERALDMGEPALATALGTLQEQMIDRDFNVRPNHDRIAELRLAITTGEMDDDEFLKAIREEVGINFSSAVATQLLDDFDNKDRYTDTFADRQVQGIISDVGAVVKERFSTSDIIEGRIPGTEKGIEAEQWLRRNIVDFIRENPEAGIGEVREYADKEMERLLKSPVWQPTAAEAEGQPQRPFGSVASVADQFGALTTNPASVLAQWMQQEMTPVQINMINLAASSLGITAQEFMSRYGGQIQGN